ncbi:hypothetical protein MMC16_002993 [Acarospora aff. strigata]|nr:hypothetical protein [Acarospora aff. strigata]
MISQAERDFRKIFTGNTTYYLDIEKHRNRSFLQRNIATVLTHHERRNESLRLRSSAREVMMTEPGPKADATESHQMKPTHHSTHRGPRWSVGELCRGVNDGSISPQRAILKVEPKALRKKPTSASNSMTAPDLRNKKSKQPDIRCYCGLTIWGPRSLEKDPLVKKSQECTIKTVITPAGEVIARIEMDEVLLVHAGELFVSVQSSTYSRMTITDSYYMEIMLLPLDSREVWPTALVKPVKGRLSPQADTTVPDQVKNDQVLVAKWTKLPACPTKGTLLSMQAFKDRKPYKANISLEIDAAWSQSTTPLENYNTCLRFTPADRFPTPVSEPDAPDSTVNVIWTLGNMPSGEQKTITLTGYLCPACQQRNFITFELLQFHLITSHDLFKFQTSMEERNETPGTLDIVRINVTVADEYRNRAANHAKDHRVFCWERPSHPFSLQSFLSGDEGWVGKPDRLRPPAVPHPILKGSRSHSRDATSCALQWTDPSTVPDLPSANRRKHAVPAAPPEVTFFRANTKRPLEEGEPVSESDDDVDEAWLRHKHEELIEHYSHVPASEKRFMKRYDTYMLKQDICGNAHFADALVRFCRENKKWLELPEMFREFLKNAGSLIAQGSTSELVLQGCVRTIQGRDKLETPTQKRKGRRRRTLVPVELESDSEEEVTPVQRASTDVNMPDADSVNDKQPSNGPPSRVVSHGRGIGLSYGLFGFYAAYSLCGSPKQNL